MNFSYVSSYDSSLIRGVDNPSTKRPWNLKNEILKYAKDDKNLLDIGCGTAIKLIPLACRLRQLIGLDISESMLFNANRNIINKKIHNMKVIHADSYFIPFKKNTFDIITCMLSCWNVTEIYRVLKPGGMIIIEHIGCEDKKEFKLLFGQDEAGWRGQFIQFQKEEYLLQYRNMFNPLFDSICILNGYWNTFYSRQGLLNLLRFTPTIRDFDLHKDKENYKLAIKFFETPQGIELTQNRILIYAKKDS